MESSEQIFHTTAGDFTAAQWVEYTRSKIIDPKQKKQAETAPEALIGTAIGVGYVVIMPQFRTAFITAIGEQLTQADLDTVIARKLTASEVTLPQFRKILTIKAIELLLQNQARQGY